MRLFLIFHCSTSPRCARPSCQEGYVLNCTTSAAGEVTWGGLIPNADNRSSAVQIGNATKLSMDLTLRRLPLSFQFG